MSADSTNIEQQTKRHRPSIIGIAIALAFAGGLFAAFLVSVSATPEDDVEQFLSTDS